MISFLISSIYSPSSSSILEIRILPKLTSNPFPILCRQSQYCAINRDSRIKRNRYEPHCNIDRFRLRIDHFHCRHRSWTNRESIKKIDAIGKLICNIDERFSPKKFQITSKHRQNFLHSVNNIHRFPLFDLTSNLLHY